VTVNKREIALFNIDGAYFAIHNLCPHEGGPLCEGRSKALSWPVPGTIWHSTFEMDRGRMAADIVWEVMTCG